MFVSLNFPCKSDKEILSYWKQSQNITNGPLVLTTRKPERTTCNAIWHIDNTNENATKKIDYTMIALNKYKEKEEEDAPLGLHGPPEKHQQTD